MGGSLVLPALRERGRAGSDLRHRIDHPGRLVPPDPERGRGITVGRARPARPDGISIGVRGDLDAPDRARVQPHPPVRRDARAERHPDQGRAAHRTARPGPQVHRPRPARSRCGRTAGTRRYYPGSGHRLLADARAGRPAGPRFETGFKMIRLATMSLAALLLSSCAMTPQAPSAARSELAPTGKLRVGINVQNFLLVNKERASGEYSGIAVDLGRELGRRLGVPVELVAFETAGKLADAVKASAWDVAFLGNEPQRAGEIAFSPAYLEIEAGYLVQAGSPIRTIGDVDRKGVRIAVAVNSAYDLYLSRSLKHATLVRVQGIQGSYDIFVKDKLEVLSGLKPRLTTDAAKLPGSRVLEGRFTAVQQSVGTPQGRPTAAKYLGEFADDVKASGFVKQAIARHAVRGVSVAP